MILENIDIYRVFHKMKKFKNLTSQENNDESLGIDRQRAFHNKSNEDRPFNPNSRSFDNSRPFNNNRNFDNTRTDRRGSFGSQNAGRVNRDDNEARGTGRFQNNRDNNREFGNRDGRPGAPRQFGGNNRFGNRREDRDFPSRPTVCWGGGGG